MNQQGNLQVHVTCIQLIAMKTRSMFLEEEMVGTILMTFMS